MTHGTRLRVVSRRCVAGRPTQKRTCASPVTFRAMPENEIPPAMRVDIYFVSLAKNKPPVLLGDIKKTLVKIKKASFKQAESGIKRNLQV